MVGSILGHITLENHPMSLVMAEVLRPVTPLETLTGAARVPGISLPTVTG